MHSAFVNYASFSVYSILPLTVCASFASTLRRQPIFLWTHTLSARPFYTLLIDSAYFLCLLSSARLSLTLSLTVRASPVRLSLRRRLSYMLFTCASSDTVTSSSDSASFRFMLIASYLHANRQFSFMHHAPPPTFDA